MNYCYLCDSASLVVFLDCDRYETRYWRYLPNLCSLVSLIRAKITKKSSNNCNELQKNINNDVLFCVF